MGWMGISGTQRHCRSQQSITWSRARKEPPQYVGRAKPNQASLKEPRALKLLALTYLLAFILRFPQTKAAELKHLPNKDSWFQVSSECCIIFFPGET